MPTKKSFRTLVNLITPLWPSQTNFECTTTPTPEILNEDLRRLLSYAHTLPVIKPYLFRSCSTLVGHTLLLCFTFKLTLSSYLSSFCALVITHLFMMLCIFIYYLDSAFSDNKHELVQVVVAANVTTHKIPP